MDAYFIFIKGSTNLYYWWCSPKICLSIIHRGHRFTFGTSFWQFEIDNLMEHSERVLKMCCSLTWKDYVPYWIASHTVQILMKQNLTSITDFRKQITWLSSPQTQHCSIFFAFWCDILSFLFCCLLKCLHNTEIDVAYILMQFHSCADRNDNSPCVENAWQETWNTKLSADARPKLLIGSWVRIQDLHGESRSRFNRTLEPDKSSFVGIFYGDGALPLPA